MSCLKYNVSDIQKSNIHHKLIFLRNVNRKYIKKVKTSLKMALTRSARSKVQKNLEHKQNEDKSGEEEKEEEMSSAKPCPLPKTVKDIGNNNNESHLNTRTAVLLLVIIFACAAAALALVYYSFPHLDS